MASKVKLPPTNNNPSAIEDSITDNRQRLQKSLRGGLLNVVKSVDSLHDSFTKSLNLQSEQIKTQQEMADARELKNLENAREQARHQEDGQQKSRGGFLGGLGRRVGGVGGLGAGAFLAGAGILAGGAGFLLKELGTLDATKIKKQVVELLSISDAFEDGSWGVFKKSGAFLTAMTGIGVGLAVFSIGSGAQQIVDRFSNDTWATSLKNNVLTLLSIKDSLGGNVRLLGDSGTFLAAMTGIGAGLAVFALGSGAQQIVDRFSNDTWATSLKENVMTLLSIKDGLGKNISMLGKSGEFVLAMTGIGIGLAAFGYGSAVARFAAPGEFAKNIKDNVLTLLSIKDGLGDVSMLGKSGEFVLAMGGIAAGLGAFALGSGVSSFVKLLSGKNFADKLKDDVETLLTIGDTANKSKASNLVYSLDKVGSALNKFAGNSFLTRVKNLGSGIFGDIDKPIKELLSLTEKNDELQKLAKTFDTLSDFKLDLPDSKMLRDFADGLYYAVPAMETAIAGGKIDRKFLGGKQDVVVKGLSSPEIDYETGIKRLNELHNIVHGTTRGAGGISGMQVADDTREVEVIKTTNNQITQGGNSLIAPTSITNNRSTRINNTTLAAPSPINTRSTTGDRRGFGEFDF